MDYKKLYFYLANQLSDLLERVTDAQLIAESTAADGDPVDLDLLLGIGDR